MSDQLRPSFQAENFRGNDSSPMRDAACQAYSPENQAVFRIDIRSTQGTESLPSLQIVFEQDGNNSRSFSGRDSGAGSRDQCDDSRRDFSPFDRSQNSDRSSHFGESSNSDQFSRNPWHHGHEHHSRGHHRLNDSSSSDGPRFLGNDRTGTSDFGRSSPFDRRSGNDNSFVSTDSPPWENQSDFSRGYSRGDRGGYRDSSRYASPLELLNQLAEYFRQNDLSNSLDGNGFTSGPGSQFRLVDSTYRPPTELPTLSGLPTPGDLLNGLPKPPTPVDLLSGMPTPPGLPKPGDLLSGLPTPPGLPKPGDLLSGLPTPPGLPNPGDLLSHLPTPPGLPSPKNIFDKLPNPFKLFG